ncbi:MinD/ParA family ATP-binding protein [Candidatus Nanohalococcus occultus]|uniref:MinD/ParA family ATP-binding protein n=1 Tax=Candidatus Nanohalococcus occultus TaxID=2978047 RepID=UPI0039E10E22
MNEARIIGVVSGKGGVGKTSVTVNVGLALKELGKEVTLVDTDFDASNLGVHLGQYDHPVKIHDVLGAEAEPEDAIFRHSTGVKAVVASNEINRVEPDTELLRYLLETAGQESDYVLVDCPPGIDTTVEEIIDACDELLIVTTPTKTAATNAAQIIEKAKRMHVPVLGTVVNMSENDPGRELVENEVQVMTESDVVAEIPHDDKMKEALFHGTPLVHHEPLSEASLKMKELAHSLEGLQYSKPSFAKFKRKLGNLKEAVSR